MKTRTLGGMTLSGLVLLLVFGLLGSRDDSRLVLSIETIRPGVTCPVQPDNGAYKLDGWKVATDLHYRRESAKASAVDLAFQTWAAEAGLTVVADPGAPIRNVAADGTNNVFVAPLSGNTIAATYVWYDRRTRAVAEFDMVFNSKLEWGNLSGTGDCVTGESRFDIQDIATHEFGHVLGIGHTSPSGGNNAQTMYPYGQAGEIYKRTLANGDIAAANAKY